MGTNTKHKSWRESIFRLLYRWLQPTHMDLPHRKEDRSLRLFSELEKSCRKGNREEDQVLAVRWRKRVLFWPVQRLSATNGNSTRIQLQVYAGAKWCNWKEELFSCGSGTGNAGGKERPSSIGPKRYKPQSTSRIGSKKRCWHMSCISEGSRIYNTWGFSVSRKYDRDTWTWGRTPGPPTRGSHIRAYILKELREMRKFYNFINKEKVDYNLSQDWDSTV